MLSWKHSYQIGAGDSLKVLCVEPTKNLPGQHSVPARVVGYPKVTRWAPSGLVLRSCDYGLVEGEPRLQAVPVDEFTNGMVVRAL